MRRSATRRSIWFWVFIAVVVILLLGLLFGGWRKGTRVDSVGTGTQVRVQVAVVHNARQCRPAPMAAA